MNDIVKKVCMCGDPNVGKTSLVRRFVSGKYDEKYISTLGTAVSRKTVKTQKQSVTMMIWDISGQPEFKRIHNSAFKNSAGGIAVCDATRPETMEHLNDWIINLRSVAGKHVPIVILTNKTDLLGENPSYLEQIESLAEKHCCSLFETSAKTGTNVEDAFKVMANAITMNASGDATEVQSSGISEEPGDIFTSTEFLDYMTVRFCEILGDEEMGMHIIRKQVKDEGLDFRAFTESQARTLVLKLVPLMENLNGVEKSRQFHKDMIKSLERVRE